VLRIDDQHAGGAGVEQHPVGADGHRPVTAAAFHVRIAFSLLLLILHVLAGHAVLLHVEMALPEIVQQSDHSIQAQHTKNHRQQLRVQDTAQIADGDAGIGWAAMMKGISTAAVMPTTADNFTRDFKNSTNPLTPNFCLIPFRGEMRFSLGWMFVPATTKARCAMIDISGPIINTTISANQYGPRLPRTERTRAA
jgi:hypothetical protein